MSQTTIWRILVVVAAALLLIGNAAIWTNRTINNEDAFVKIARERIDREESREAIAGEIVFAMMGNQPLIYQFAREPAERAVTRLLATPAFDPLLDQVASNLHELIVTGEEPPITIGAAFLPPIVAAIIAATGPAGLFTFEDQQLQLRVFANQEVPTLEWLVDPLRKVGLFCGLTGIIILGLAIIIASDRRLGLRRAGIALFVVALVTLLATFPLRSLYRSRVDGDAAEAIAPGVINALTSSLVVQTLLLLVPAAILVALSLRWRSAMAVAPEGRPG